jgi:hypothetical protein
MKFAFDHLFICTDIGASVAADRLVAFGLVEGLPNTHPGQGTANRRFFFHNGMLELLWICDEPEARSESIARTRLWERWTNRNRGACPFGVCLRPAAGEGDSVAFASWAYHPPYLPATMRIAVGTNSEVLTEPMLFQVQGRIGVTAQNEHRDPAGKSQPPGRSVELREITRVELVSPSADRPSSELRSLVDTNCVKLRSGAEYSIELGFDREVQGQQVDFRPELPLILSW